MRIPQRRSSRASFAQGLVILSVLAALVALALTAGGIQAQATVPAAPTGLAGSVDHDSVTLSWDDPGDSSITGYQVLRRSRDGPEYGDGEGATEFVTIVDDTGSPATTYTDTSVTARTRYVYRVKAINSVGLSPRSSYLNIETSAAPTGLTASSVAHDSVTLSWDDPGDRSITGYQVLRRSRDGSEYGDGEGATGFVVIVDDTGSQATIYTDTSVTARTRYVYRVKAINSAGTSWQSPYLNVETTAAPASPGVPAAPTGLTAPTITHDSIALNWDDPDDSSITGYQVLRHSLDGDEYGDGRGAAEFVAIVDNTGSSATSYIDTSVTARTRYVYRVKARNPQGLSEASSNANAESHNAPPDTPQSPVQGSRPNVVLILADDLGWGDIQSNNPDSAMTTPRIDSIAAAGAYFTDAHTPSSMCSPTRYGLLTGRYAWRSWLQSGVLGGHSRPMIGPGRPTVGTLLQGHGYRTAAIGKWHLGMDFARLSDVDEVMSINQGIDFDAEIVDGPLDHGFGEFFGTSANLRWQPHAYIRNNRFVANPETSGRSDPGFYEYDEVLDRLTEEAVAFIEREGQTDAPFFLYLPLHTPHVPLAPNADFDGLTGLGRYADVVAQMDWAVGQVLDALVRAGARADTLVVFTSDNGSGRGGIPIPNHAGAAHMPNGQWRGGKGHIHEGGHRVPLLMQWPRGIESGSTVAATVSLTDLYATLAEILGEEPDSGVATDSVSVLPLLRGEADTRGALVVHHSRYGMFALRDGRWKLVFGNGDGGPHGAWAGEPFGRPWPLFDLEQDPGEASNVATAHPEVVARMEVALQRIRAAEDGGLSADATLRSLNFAGIDIGPFASDVRTYTATVGSEVSTVEVTAIPTATDALVTITDANGPRERGRHKVRLAESTTTITVTVTAPDKSATTEYTVTVTRADEAPNVPTIVGTAEVGETLTVDTSGISDADGLTGATFSYQWVSYDGKAYADIQGATDSTYTLVSADEGKAFKVRVSFTDDAGYKESLTSALFGSERPYGLTASESDGAVVLTWKLPAGWTHGSTFQILRKRPELGETAPLVHVQYLQTTANAYTDTAAEPEVLYVYRVKWVDPFGSTGEASHPLEIRTAAATPVENNPASGAPSISGAAQVDETLTADVSGIADADGLTSATFSYQWLSNDGTAETHIVGATGSTYTPTSSEEGQTVQVRVSFIDDRGNEESLTSEATEAVAAAPNPLTASIHDPPNNHDGRNPFTFELRFSEEPDPDFSYKTLRDHAFSVTGGTVTKARRLAPPGNVHWEITVLPNSNDDVSVVLSVTRDCGDQGAVCTGDGRMLSAEVELTAAGPAGEEGQTPRGNNPATGAPTIRGTARVGATLRVSLSALDDADGLSGATFTYQWLADDADIEDATGSIYVLDADDEGKTIRVRLSFTDDTGNEETLTSAPAAAVAQAKAEEGPTEPPPAPLNLTARANADGSVTVSWDAPDDDSITGYQVLRRHPGEAEYSMVESAVHTGGTETTYTDDGLTEDVLHAYGVRAINAAGSSERSNYDNAVPHRLIPIDFGLGAPTVHLTFDDGPREPYTAQMLDLLEKYGARATFFVIGSSAALHPDIIARMARARHGIGNHTWQHERLTELSRENFDSTVSRTQEQIGAHATRCLRPPYGATDANTGAWAGSLGLQQMKWTFDSGDHTGPSVDTLVSRLSRVSNGSVVLLHEHGGGGGTIEAVRIMLDRWARQGYQFKPVCKPPSVPFAPLNNPSEGAPTVSGPVQVGRVLTSDTSGIADGDGLSGASFSYQWYADNAKIASATDSSYLIAAEHEGKTIVVQVSFEDEGGSIQQLRSVPTAAVTEAERVSGSPEVPQDLSVSPTDSEGDLSVTWNAASNRGGPEITGYRVEWKLSSGYWGRESDVSEILTTGTSHRITGLTEASQYVVRVRAVSQELEGAASVEILAAPMGPAPLLAEFRNKPASHEGGGSHFSVHIAFSEAIDHGYIEFRDGTLEVDGGMVLEASRVDRRSDLWRLAILPHGSGHVTIRLPASEDCSIWGAVCTADGKKLSNRLEFTVSGSSTPVPVQAPDNAPSTGAPVVTGTVQVGQPLTAGISGINDADGLSGATFTYQWLVDDAEIQDATDSTYVLGTDDEGKTIKVRVSFTDDAGNEETLTSAPTAQVARSSNHPATGPPVIRGQVRVGATLRVSLSSLDDADGLSGAAFTYQWLADDVDTQDATNSTYVLDPDDEGKTIRVRVSFTDDAGNEETLTSAPTAQVVPTSNNPATGLPVIRGQVRVGATLRASLSILDDPDGLSGATFTYQWLADDADIEDATGSIYVLDAYDEGKTIRVRLSFTDDAGNEETLTSVATSAVERR